MKKSLEFSRSSVVLALAFVKNVKVPGAVFLGTVAELLGEYLSTEEPWLRLTIESSKSKQG